MGNDFDPEARSPGGDWLVGRKAADSAMWSIIADYPNERDAEAAALHHARKGINYEHAVFVLTKRYTTTPQVSISARR